MDKIQEAAKDLFWWIHEQIQSLTSIEIIFFSALILGLVIFAIVLIFRRSSYVSKLNRNCKSIKRVLINTKISEENLESFTAKCFGKKVVTPLTEGWKTFLAERFGYPSEVITEQNILNRKGLVSNPSCKGVSIFNTIYSVLVLLVLTVLTTITLSSNIVLYVFSLMAIVGIILNSILKCTYRRTVKNAINNYYSMIDLLDTKIELQIEADYTIDVEAIDSTIEEVESVIIEKEEDMRKQSELKDKPQLTSVVEPTVAPIITPIVEPIVTPVVAVVEPTVAPIAPVVIPPIEVVSDRVLAIEDFVNKKVLNGKVATATFRTIATLLAEAKSQFSSSKDQELLDIIIRRVVTRLKDKIKTGK